MSDNKVRIDYQVIKGLKKCHYIIHDKPNGYTGSEWFSRFTTETLKEAKIVSDQRRCVGKVKITMHEEKRQSLKQRADHDAQNQFR